MTGIASSTDSFSGYVESRRAAIEEALRRFLPAPPACPAIVAEAMRYSLDAGGKRLRAILTLAAADALTSAPDRAPGCARTVHEAHHLAMPAACAIELIHTYSLIHDDLPAMDDDTMRRGRPTLHVAYGEGIAILAGDALQAEAFGLLAREPATPFSGGALADSAEGLQELQTRKLRTAARIAAAAGACGMVGGQAVDLEATGTTRVPGRERPVLDASGLRAMHAMKTGALIRAAAVSGAIMAGGTPAQVDAIDRFAAELGLAFQIVDDILDVEEASDALGKTAGKDAAADKLTYPALFGVEASRRLADEAIDRAESALRAAGLIDGRLLDIAAWVVRRRS
ncbi:MAG TPA: farnesyl diphosphate synthase [Vicinamibacterales bacterium]